MQFFWSFDSWWYLSYFFCCMLLEVVASCLLLVWIPLLWWWISRTYNILDKPGHDVPKRNRVPTLQWIGSIVAVVVTTLFFRPELLTAPYMVGLRVWLLLLVVVNFIDELGRLVDPKYRLSPKVKFVIQVAAALIALLVSGVWFTSLSLWWTMITFNLFISACITIAWFGLCTNAINRFDGVYGLASWSSAIWFITIASLLTWVVLPLYPGIDWLEAQMVHAAIWCAWLFSAVTIVATVMEFRPFWLMREVGTMSFWFALAYLSLLWWAKIGTIIVVLLLPLFDAVRVIIDRVWFRKVSPFKGDFTHLHYRLMALGRSRTEVRVVLWALSSFLAILMLLQWWDRRDKAIIFLLVAIIFFAVNGYLFWIKKLPKAYMSGEKSDDDLEENYM